MIDLTGRKSSEELEKVPMPSNKHLELLFQKIDKIVIKDDGVWENHAIGNEILFTISEKNKLVEFSNLLKIDEDMSGFYCMCLGNYAIELYSENNLIATFGFHHGHSIRYSKWRSDVGLAKSEEFLQFLFELGFKKPLQEWIKQKKIGSNRQEEKWFRNAPKCFNKYQKEINNLDENYFPSLIEDFTEEVSDKSSQIICLLKLFSVSQNLWSAYPICESVPEKILSTYTIQEIIFAYENSEKSRKTQIGLGRFLCSFDFQKQWKKYAKQIPQDIVDDIKQVFTAISQKEGLSRIEKLQKLKAKN